MEITIQSPSGAEFLGLLAGRASRDGVPEHVVDYCVRVTGRRFGPLTARPLGQRDAARLRAYFEGVVRRRAMRSRGNELLDMRQRYVLTSLAEDLRGAGVGRERVLRELLDFCGETVPEQEVAKIVDIFEPECDWSDLVSRCSEEYAL